MNFWQEKIKIKHLEIPRFISAPMDGITDSPMRQIVRFFSPDVLLFSQMRHVAYITHADNPPCLNFKPIEKPLCFQISTNETTFIASALKKIFAHDFDMLNLNAGCPAKKNVQSGCGAALMADIPKLKEIIKTIIANIPKHIPFTVKMRAGFKEKNALDVAKICQDFGAAALIIHPRTQPQKHSTELDFDLVQEIKATVEIPVIFSGNITNFDRAKITYEQTKCDGFMIGRALWGAPWKIREIMQQSEGKKCIFTIKQQLETIITHLTLNTKFYGENQGVKLFRYHLAQYLKTIPKAENIRKLILTRTNELETKKLLHVLIQNQI
jgi:nifR3 family TIM-barrel protein